MYHGADQESVDVNFLTPATKQFFINSISTDSIIIELMEFYGRESQRKSLHRILDRGAHQIGLIYGRRRVGKSELIKQVRTPGSRSG